MQHDLIVYIEDILSSINAIEEYSKSHDFESYKANRMVKKAVERELEIIGEAMNSILKINPEIAVTNSRKIVDLRNLISHGYATVNDRIVWSVVTNNLLILKKEMENLNNS